MEYWETGTLCNLFVIETTGTLYKPTRHIEYWDTRTLCITYLSHRILGHCINLLVVDWTPVVPDVVESHPRADGTGRHLQPHCHGIL